MVSSQVPKELLVVVVPLEVVTLNQGLDALLDAFDTHNLDYCITSGSSARRLDAAMSLLGWKRRFKHRCFSAEPLEAGKPAPDLFLHAASEVGVLPQNCAVVEASAAGIKAATQANMFSIGFVGGSHFADILAERRKLLRREGAHFCLNAFSELSFCD